MTNENDTKDNRDENILQPLTQTYLCKRPTSAVIGLRKREWILLSHGQQGSKPSAASYTSRFVYKTHISSNRFEKT